jgi:hypothetical protein
MSTASREPGPALPQSAPNGESPLPGWLGVQIQDVTPDIAKNLDLPQAQGALVAGVNPDGPAAIVGIKPGDVIESYQRSVITNAHDLAAAVAKTEVGREVHVTVRREGTQFTFVPTITAMRSGVGANVAVEQAPLKNKPITTADTRTSAPAESSELPGAEQELIAIVRRYAAAYNSASNDMARGALRPQRAAAICALHLGTVTGWYGKVSALSSNNEGKGVLAIQIADEVTVGTTNNSLSDGLASIPTLIPIGSDVQAAAMQLKKGQLVQFSGRFGSHRDDCLEETSLTVWGAMTDPEFLFQFSTIGPATVRPQAQLVSQPKVSNSPVAEAPIPTDEAEFCTILKDAMEKYSATYSAASSASTQENGLRARQLRDQLESMESRLHTTLFDMEQRAQFRF